MPKLAKGPVPLYYQLEQILRNRILSNEIKPNEPMPTEMVLCQEYGISRATVRQAFKALENEALIRREQGRGTFVMPRDHNQRVVKLYGAFDDLLLSGIGTTLVLKTKTLISPTDDIIKEMKLDPGEKVYLFTGIRLIESKQNVAYFQAFIPKAYGDKISLNENMEKPWFIRKVEEVAMQTTSRIRKVIMAKEADEVVARETGVKKGSPVLVIKRIYFTKDDGVLEMAITSIPGETFSLDLEMVLSNTDSSLFQS